MGVVVELIELYLFVRGEVGATNSEEPLGSFIHNWNCDKDERRRFQSYKNQAHYLNILTEKKSGFEDCENTMLSVIYTFLMSGFGRV